MQAVNEPIIATPPAPLPSIAAKTSRRRRLKQTRILIILATVALGLGTRLYRLSAAGLAEDEVNKIFAIRCYQLGDFTVNAEHPMVMKLLCLASVDASHLWNRLVGPTGFVSEEFALRFPNAVFGALIVIPLFLLAESLLGLRVAGLTAFLWSTGLNAIWFNRIAKEDSLLVFFMITAFFLYNKAKTLPESKVRHKEIYYGLSGAAFALMFASKYFPHYYGLLMLFYYLSGTNAGRNLPLTGRMKKHHFAAMLGVFVVFNFALFLPSTWHYLWNYIHENLQTHHGYLVRGNLYQNDFSYTPGGPPWYFYWLYLLVKMPIPTILAFVIGTVEIFRRRRSAHNGSGYLFLRLMLFFWLIPMSFIGAKFLRYTLALMPFVYMTAAVGIAQIWKWLARKVRAYPESRFENGSNGYSGISSRVRPLAATAISALLVVFVALPAITAFAHVPYPGLYTNAFGGGRVGYYFPHDEYYDLGARESIRYIAINARPGATVATEIPATLDYYLGRFGRTDIRSVILSHPGEAPGKEPDFVLIQPGRVYYENRESILRIESRLKLVQQSVYGDAVATRLYQNAQVEAPVGKDAVIRSRKPWLEMAWIE